VQEVHVQGVAGNPFAAIEQSTEGSDVLGDLGLARCFDRLAGRGLVGDRTDSADPRCDVGGFGVLPPTQEGLEETRWLVNLQLGALYGAVLDDDAKPTFTLDPSE